MSPILAGALVLLGLLACLAIGMPIAFALGFVSIVALVLTDGWWSLSILGETTVAARLPFALLGIATVVLCYFTGCALWRDRRAADGRGADHLLRL